MKTLLETIKQADEVEIDACWMIIRDRKNGILRKLRCLALVLDIEEEIVLQEAPKDENGRILDRETRHAICEVLVSVSKQQPIE